ncbi:MAG: glycosyltransferase [Actinobacteria bacterium]|nr:glycosyltransferase [Actinomycetota bacterium]
MTPDSDQPSAEVVALAEQRAEARSAKDFARSDALRDEIATLGFVVTDTPAGYALAPPTTPNLFEIARVADVTQSWTACVEALLRHTPDDVVVVALDLGNVDGAGLELHRLAQEYPTRVIDAHVSSTTAQAGWSSSLTAVMRACAPDVIAVMDNSTVLDGDAITQLLELLDDASVVAAGWRGVDVDLDDNWRSFVDAGPGDVDALLGYLLVVRRAAALASPPHPKARFYRNADMEWCLAMREAGGRLVAGPAALPVHQERHHGYHDSDPEYRDRESRRTYDRLLQRFRGHLDALRPRTAPSSESPVT